jgi:hypothetical protein
MNNLETALRLAQLSKQKDDIEKEIKALKAQLIEAYPMITSGFSPEYFTVSLADQVVVQDQAQAAEYFLSHPQYQVLFKLSCAKEAFLKMGCPEFAVLEKKAPSIKVDAKLLKTALAAVAEDMAA